MKSQIFGLAFLALFGFSSFSQATEIESGVEITVADCAVLGESVRLNLSRGVAGAYECSEANNSINVGACHEAGSRTDQLACAQVGIDPATLDPLYNDPACNATNAGTTITLAAPRYRGFRAATTGGSVGAQQLTGNCTATTAEELVQ
ncbi:hypothetical protein [Pseudomonas sp. TMP25]|uniref:hypothetical protein n=1 Tax=Pseudomonas sp. TMP25 TaxID=3136561 RepID=UPI003100CA65